MKVEEVCYTREVALEKAIEIEQKSFETYLKAYRIIQNRPAKKLIKELALEELEHKYILEKAFFEETVSLHDAGLDKGPSMKFTIFLTEKPLDETSSTQDVLVYAIYDEKRSVDFYGKMAKQCAGAPMAQMFQRLHQDEAAHLFRLEELYGLCYL
jgi:rubrerythrin